MVLFGVVLGFLQNFENSFGMRMCYFGGVYLVKFIHLIAPDMIFGLKKCGNFWFLKFFKNGFGMRMCDIGRGVYLMTFIHLRAPYMIFGF